MAKVLTIRWGVMILGLSLCAGAQDNSQQQQQGTPPAPAFGQQNAPILNPENPPVSGLDEPGLNLQTASRSFIAPAIEISETADTNENNQLSTKSLRSVSHVLGALDLQEFWPKSDLFVEYLGGGAFNTAPYDVRQLQAMGLEGVTRWRTGYVKLRDSFNYLPDGSFDAGVAGGMPGLGLALGGLGTGEGLPGLGHFGKGAFGGIGSVARLANTAVVDAVQAITPRSAVTAAVGFSNAHFYHNTEDLINSDQTTVELGYSHMISRRDQLAGVYGFQLFRFPFDTGGEIYNNVFNLRYSHTISGRMRLIIGLGPQYTDLKLGGSEPHWSLSGRATLRYEFRHSSLVAAWEKFTSPGSGFFAGADTQVARLAFRRPVARSFEVQTDLGFSHNHRLQPPGGGGVDVNSYNEGFASLILRRHMGRTWDLFAAYRFTEVDFSGQVCFAGSPCGKVNQRHSGTIGLQWHPKPTRIE
jgi:hypothetical protein